MSTYAVLTFALIFTAAFLAGFTIVRRQLAEARAESYAEGYDTALRDVGLEANVNARWW